MMLADAFRAGRGDIVALVGAGGKTAAMYALGDEAVKRGLKVVLTTTTRIYFPGDRKQGQVVLEEGPGIIGRVREALRDFQLVVAGAGPGPGGKVRGVEKDLAGSFLEAGADMVVVEADGAAGRPFKAPRNWEPVLPPAATLVIPVVGVDCLGRPLTGDFVHSPETAASIAGTLPGSVVTPGLVALVLLSPLGYRRGVPPGCRWVPLINKVNGPGELEAARDLAGLLICGGARAVVIGSAGSADPVKEVVAP